MPAKKAASRKRKAAGASRKKAAPRKAAASRKTTGSKRKVSRKKSPTSSTAARKKSSKKTVARKSAAKKATAKKTPSRKAASPSKKKASAAAAKAPSRKAAAPKKAAKKKPAASKTAPRASSATKKSPNGAPVKAAAEADHRSRQEMLSGPIHGIKPYVPKRGEEYMSPRQLAHFEAILRSWKLELMNEVDRTVHHMQDEAANFPDPNDRATQESEFGLELRTRDRERKLLRKIDSALQRIEDGSYGYCDETGEEIGLKRLEARPVATLCLEAQERREMAERQFRDRDDRYR